MFGSGSIESLFAAGELKLTADTRETKLWTALRGSAEAPFIGLCAQNVLARLPYGAATEEIDSFAFEEFGEEFSHGDYLWFNPCFVLTLLVAGSYRRYGSDLWGRLANEVGKLPVHTFASEGESHTKPVAEVCLTESAAEVLVENGLIALAAFRDSDRLRVIRWQSVAAPATSLGGK
jgi:type VI secretion system protein ImpC